MLRRLVPGLLVAAALVAAAYARDDRAIETRVLSHGAADCDADGVSVGYEVAFIDDRSPSGYRVQTVTVDGIASECEGHDLVVGLFDGADTVGRSRGTPISGSTMTLPLREEPLVAAVDGVSVKIDQEILPPVEPTPSPSATVPTDAPGGGGERPEPVPSTTPPLQPDPQGDPLPASECDPTVGLCGTSGDDRAHISNGKLATGPGKDTIAIVTDPATSLVDVDAGLGNDSIRLEISAPAGATQGIVVDAGSGSDRIVLSFGQIELGATFEITIVAAGGDDVIELPASLPPGVTVRIVAGSGDDVVSATGGSGTAIAPVMLAWVSGGYRIDGGAGNDNLRGGIGPDLVTGGRGSDVIAGSAGHDVLRGGSHGDVVRGGSGNDHISAQRGGDTIWGGSGTDVLRAGRGRDVCRGGRGDDRFASCEGSAR